jgi:hypothetical protein
MVGERYLTVLANLSCNPPGPAGLPCRTSPSPPTRRKIVLYWSSTYHDAHWQTPACAHKVTPYVGSSGFAGATTAASVSGTLELATGTAMIRVLIVEDSPFVRKALHMRLTAEADLSVIGEAAGGVAASRRRAGGCRDAPHGWDRHLDCTSSNLSAGCRHHTERLRRRSHPGARKCCGRSGICRQVHVARHVADGDSPGGTVAFTGRRDSPCPIDPEVVRLDYSFSSRAASR